MAKKINRKSPLTKTNSVSKDSPFRKGEGDDASYDIPKWRDAIDKEFGEFQDFVGEGGENITNLWAGARNQMQIGDHFGGVKTQFDNQYAGIENQMANLQNRYAGMENTMEDLTVNQQQAQFEKEMAQQTEANTMQQFRAAAGGSGVAGLAQAMANQGQIRAQRASASIGQQERANQMAAAQQGASIQQMQAQGASAVDLARAQGAERTQMAIAQGAQQADQMQMQAELQKAQGMQAADITRGQGAMEAQKIRLQGAADQRDLQLQSMQGSLAFMAGMLGAAEANQDADTRKSDRKLKKNIIKIGESPSGLNIYEFEYKNPIDGVGLFQGVMSDEVPKNAVINNGEFDMVNYSMLDVEFKQL